MAEGDWAGWKILTEKLGSKLQLVGDDLFVTNTKILKEGIEKQHRQRHPDQGEPDRHADRDAGGHRDGRGGEATPPSSRIARARPKTTPSPTSPWPPPSTQIKTGSMSRSDRVAKYNQLLRIEARAGCGSALCGARGIPFRALAL